MSDDSKYIDELAKLLFPRQATPEQIRECFEAVGYGLSAWQLVEEELYLIFEKCLAPERPGAAGCAFHTLQFGGKLDATGAAVRFAILSAPENKQQSLVELWEDIHDKSRKKVSARNALAHFQVRIYVDQIEKDKRVMLEPHTHDYRYAAGIIKTRKYTMNDIKVNGEGFRTLAMNLASFRAKGYSARWLRARLGRRICNVPIAAWRAWRKCRTTKECRDQHPSETAR